jgi:membrane protein YqaA with SNARE-associated domain
MPLLVLTAAAAAGLGRYVLARAAKLLAHRFSERSRRNLDAAHQLIAEHRAGRLLGLVMFVFTPLPSAQLFEAAGLAGVRLWPCTAAFMLGRLGFYSAYAFAAREVQASSFGEKFASPLAIAVQIAVIGLLVLFIRADWSRWLKRPPDR